MDPIECRTIHPFEIEEPKPSTPSVTQRVGNLWQSLPRLPINVWYPVQLANTGYEKAMAYIYGTPALVMQGLSYETNSAVENLRRRGAMLTSGTVSLWMEHLKSSQGERLHWIAPCLFNNRLENLEEIIFAQLATVSEEAEFVSIPIIVQGAMEKHLVHVLIQLRGRIRPLVEYLDPFGYEPEQDAATILNAVKSHYEDIDNYPHKKMLQNDRHNCAVVVSWHVYQRVVCRVPHDKISSLPRDFEAFRHEMVRLLTT